MASNSAPRRRAPELLRLLVEGPVLARRAFPRGHHLGLRPVALEALVVVDVLGPMTLPAVTNVTGHHRATVSRAVVALSKAGFANNMQRDRWGKVTVELTRSGDAAAEAMIRDAWMLTRPNAREAEKAAGTRFRQLLAEGPGVFRNAFPPERRRGLEANTLEVLLRLYLYGGTTQRAFTAGLARSPARTSKRSSSANGSNGNSTSDDV